MTSLELIKAQILGALAPLGEKGSTIEEIENDLPMGAIRKYKETLPESPTFSVQVLSMVLGQMTQEGSVSVKTFTDIVRYSIKVQDKDLVKEIERLKQRVETLERAVTKTDGKPYY